MDKKIKYLQACLPAAEKAAEVFNMNPRVILAQGALESGWGTSRLATEARNYFGIMAYGASNAWWHGAKVELAGSNGPYFFRRYGSVELSFLDFARLVRTGYPRAWSFSRIPEAYAREIAYSPYISELNGDNRELYRHSLIEIEREISLLIDMMKTVAAAAA